MQCLNASIYSRNWNVFVVFSAKSAKNEGKIRFQSPLCCIYYEFWPSESPFRANNREISIIFASDSLINEARKIAHPSADWRPHWLFIRERAWRHAPSQPWRLDHLFGMDAYRTPGFPALLNFPDECDLANRELIYFYYIFYIDYFAYFSFKKAWTCLKQIQKMRKYTYLVLE